MRILILLSLLLSSSVAQQAHALPPASPSLAALLLARTCVKEAGWEITEDCAAIHAVLQKRADLESHTYYEQMLERYSKASVDRPWLQQLDVWGSQPASWPAGVQWKKVHRLKWMAMLAHATSIVEGRTFSSCDPDHWGDSRGDHKRAVRNGWTQISCGATKNEFWVVKPPEDCGS